MAGGKRPDLAEDGTALAIPERPAATIRRPASAQMPISH
jgi:hypothetical protein